MKMPTKLVTTLRNHRIAVFEVHIDLSALYDKQRRELVGAIRTGMYKSNTMLAHLYKELMVDAGVPWMTVTKGSPRTGYCAQHGNLPAATIKKIRELYEADQTALKLDNTPETAYSWHRRFYAKQEFDPGRHRFTLWIVRNLDRLYDCAATYAETDDYKAKVASIIAKVEAGETLHVECS